MKTWTRGRRTLLALLCGLALAPGAAAEPEDAPLESALIQLDLSQTVLETAKAGLPPHVLESGESGFALALARAWIAAQMPQLVAGAREILELGADASACGAQCFPEWLAAGAAEAEYWPSEWKVSEMDGRSFGDAEPKPSLGMRR